MKKMNPSTVPPIYYCKKHELFINLMPSCSFNSDHGFRVVCGDCGVFGPWKKSLVTAISFWNKYFGTAKNENIKKN